MEGKQIDNGKAPSFKLQASKKIQSPNIDWKLQVRVGFLELDAWCFYGSWILDLGA